MKGMANSFTQLEIFKSSNYHINLEVIQYLFTADGIVTKSRLEKINHSEQIPLNIK